MLFNISMAIRDHSYCLCMRLRDTEAWHLVRSGLGQNEGLTGRLIDSSTAMTKTYPVETQF